MFEKVECYFIVTENIQRINSCLVTNFNRHSSQIYWIFIIKECILNNNFPYDVFCIGGMSCKN